MKAKGDSIFKNWNTRWFSVELTSEIEKRIQEEKDNDVKDINMNNEANKDDEIKQVEDNKNDFDNIVIDKDLNKMKNQSKYSFVYYQDPDDTKASKVIPFDNILTVFPFKDGSGKKSYTFIKECYNNVIQML